MRVPILWLSCLVLCLAGCPGSDDDDTAPADDDDTTADDDDTTADDDDTSDDDDSADDDDTADDDDSADDVDLDDPCGEEPIEGDVIVDCTPTEGTNELVLVNATALLPSGPLADAEVLWSTTTGELLCADADCSGQQGYADATRICGDVVLPAFVNPHDHMQYNVLGPWEAGRLWENRYAWRGDSDYRDYRDQVYEVDDCTAMAWAEVRAIATGTASVAGSDIDGCDPILVRNLDEEEEHHGLAGYELKLRTDDPGSDEEDLVGWCEDLDSGDLDAYVPHVGEGLYGTVRTEFQPLIDAGLLRPETAVIHGTDLDPMQLTRMATTGTHLVWSPQSNIHLYGRTADITAAHHLGVPIAIGPDWTLSGTAGQLFELQCAARLNREAYHGTFCLSDMVGMATHRAADALGLGGVLGELTPGVRADLLVLTGDQLSPYTTVLTADQTQVALVTVDGAPLYGDAEVLDLFPGHLPYPNELCDDIEFCGTTRTVCLRAAEDQPGYHDLRDDLVEALGSDLFEVLFCPDDPGYEPERCAMTVIGGPGDDDEDLDGVDVFGAHDNCPRVFNPDQRDEDGDGQGHACDPDPWEPSHSGPTGVTADDWDGDGVDNTTDPCPWDHNPGAYTDTDGDGLGDDCDRCPSDPDLLCTEAVHIRQWDHWLHPYEGEQVVMPAMEVTAIEVDDDGYTNFYAQQWGYWGLFAYHLVGDAVAVGDEVTISGEYDEYYGQSEVAFGTVEVTGAFVPATPAEHADPCALATWGVQQHFEEGLLVAVIDGGPYTVTEVDTDHHEFLLEDCLWIDDDLVEVSLPSVGQQLTSITGILHYSWNESRLAPRSQDDLVY